MEYIERVLLRHTALAAAIEDARAPEAVDAMPEAVVTSGGTVSGGAEEASPEAAQALADDGGTEPSPLAALAEELQDYAAARQAAQAVRQRAARFETVRASGEAGAAAGGQTGGVRTSVSAQMQVTGLAGAQTAWSMAEISRFFERDARRYGG